MSDRLLLLQEITNYWLREFRPRPELLPDFLDKFRGIGKTDSLPPNDVEVEAMLEESLV
ncbi:MAG: hypothetical protein F6K40_28805 [Okeania sp. SIO3I5]|uniref:hypothetical protein n=1 Tax=Okeania sp. SIO3I5 TaxID=2607805 RepID=UPI0013B8CC23|nr:hypothetical protein [Okeania sp. SIO3I5]NEQ40026.1 hypothetical protein [Okeania sp. SIO3I5]NEQ40027.1 hypothetical protein [Okeania sp. SIO3I5]